MITPPFNIWAKPDLTPNVPVWDDLEVVDGSERTGRGMEAEAELVGLEVPLVAGVEVPLTVDPLGRERFPLVSWIAKSIVEEGLGLGCVKRVRGYL